MIYGKTNLEETQSSKCLEFKMPIGDCCGRKDINAVGYTRQRSRAEAREPR